ncbi:MAG: hypothetical protein E7054_08295 [Lentisphaerae bacterium]|nr:hypothetical protein [Lentisphaerota bacterium]
MRKFLKFCLSCLPEITAGKINSDIAVIRKRREAEYSDRIFPLDKDLIPGENITFIHSGNIGDILFSLYFCKELSHALGLEKFNFHIRTGDGSNVLQLTAGAAEFLLPLLKVQPFIDNVTFGETTENISNRFDLDQFRELPLNPCAGQIQNWYYHLSSRHLPREFWKPVLEVKPDDRFKDKIILISTPRYQNPFVDLKALERFKERFVFAGLPEEHSMFQKRYFQLEYFPASTMLEIACCMAGAAGVIGNQSGLYTIAECLKVPRILIAPAFVMNNGRLERGPHNNQVQGGWGEDVSTTSRLTAMTAELFRQ